MTTFNRGSDARLCTAFVGRLAVDPRWVADTGMDRIPFEEDILEFLAVETFGAGEVMLYA